jgi:dihydrofolate reductase
MPELFADVFISVDGSASGARSPGYFGFHGPQLQRWIDEEQARQRLDVMGRKTYQTLATLPHEHQDESWRRMVTRPATVFSRTLTHADWPGVELCSSDAVTEMRRRKEGAGPDLRTVGSLSLVRQFLRAGLVDHLRLMIFPLVIGETGQQPIFQDVGDFQLRLHAQTVLDERIVLLDYRPGGAPPYTT